MNKKNYFSSPIWVENHSNLLYLNTYCDKYLKRALEETYKGDRFAQVVHSANIAHDYDLKPLADLVGKCSHEFLDEQGYDLKPYTLLFTEFWVQEFTKKGGGHHHIHTHRNNHVSGFYFLACDGNTSYPVFYDPRPGAVMTRLKQKDEDQITDAIDAVHYRPNPGDLVLFNSYLPHSFIVDPGISTFRFIHFNLQVVPKAMVKNG